MKNGQVLNGMCMTRLKHGNVYVLSGMKKDKKVQMQYHQLYEQNLNLGIAKRLRKQIDH